MTGTFAKVVGWLLVAGAVSFWIGAGTPPYKQWMGPPIREYLAIIGAHRLNWLFIHGAFALGCVLNLAGLAGLTALLRDAGDKGWSSIGLALVGVGSALWLVNIGHRVGVTPWAAAELARTGEVPAGFEAGKAWMGLVFGAFMVTTYLGVAAYGAALHSIAASPRWLAWTAIVFGLVAVPGLATPLFQPPLMVHVVPFIAGVVLIRSA